MELTRQLGRLGLVGVAAGTLLVGGAKFLGNILPSDHASLINDRELGIDIDYHYNLGVNTEMSGSWGTKIISCNDKYIVFLSNGEKRLFDRSKNEVVEREAINPLYFKDGRYNINNDYFFIDWPEGEEQSPTFNVLRNDNTFETFLHFSPGSYFTGISISPDGNKIALSILENLNGNNRPSFIIFNQEGEIMYTEEAEITNPIWIDNTRLVFGEEDKANSIYNEKLFDLEKMLPSEIIERGNQWLSIYNYGGDLLVQKSYSTSQTRYSLEVVNYDTLKSNKVLLSGDATYVIFLGEDDGSLYLQGLYTNSIFQLKRIGDDFDLTRHQMENNFTLYYLCDNLDN